jgi:hypothetical protein
LIRVCALQRGKWPFIDGSMTDGISRRWAYADTDATSGACIWFDHRARSAIIVDHAHCTIDGAVIDTERARLSLPGQAGITIDGSMRHLDWKFMAKDSRIAGIDARQIAAHDTWSTQGINHRGALPCWAGGFRGRTDGSWRAGIDAVAASRTCGKKLSLGHGTGRSLQEPQ